MKRIYFAFIALFNSIALPSGAQLTGVANDCVDAIPICSNQSYNTGTTVSQGDDCDITALNRGCIGGAAGTTDPYPAGSAPEVFCRYEYSPTFFYFQIQTGGLLEFMAKNSGADLDFALYGPCPGTGLADYCTYMRTTPPVRCNFNSSPGGGTGMINAGGGGPGSPISANLAVTGGQVYVLLIQQWGFPPSPVGFDLFFNEGTGTNDANSTCTFNCMILPVQLSRFEGWSTPAGVALEWASSLEEGASHFVVARWDEEGRKEQVATVQAEDKPHSYTFTDRAVKAGLYQYQIISHTDDGSQEYSEKINVKQVFDVEGRSLVKVVNLQGVEVDPATQEMNQVLLYVYDNGETERRVNLR